MSVTAAFMIAQGFDASVAQQTCQFHTEASIAKLVDLKARCEAAELRSAQDYLGSDWGKLGLQHYKLAATLGGKNDPTLRALGGKQVAGLVSDLVAAGYATELAGGKYRITRKGSDNGRAADVAAGRTWAILN